MTNGATERTSERIQDRIVWIDCEMTGLELGSDALIEVAALVTDSELNVLGDGVDVVIKPPAGAVEQMNDLVRTMHTSSGLLAELDGGMSMEEAEATVLAYVKQWVPDARKVPLGGNTVATDRGFLARDMPALESHLHYRMVDVSSIKELARRWYPRVYFAAPAKHGGHRALADIRESIEELKYYREALFVRLPGPDTETARGIAAKYVLAAAPAEETAAVSQGAAAVSQEPAAVAGDRAAATGDTAAAAELSLGGTQSEPAS